MKCQKCGEKEVNFFYSSNINGAVTETHLCSDCADGDGYDIIKIYDITNMIEGLMPIFGMHGLLPIIMPRIASRKGVESSQIEKTGTDTTESREYICDCGNKITGHWDSKTNDKLTQYRQLNMQMRAAVEKEEFEKAAVLRDKIKELGQ